MQVQIASKTLLAAAHCMAKDDIRFYLNGVLLDVTGPTEAFIVSTDGHILFACRTELEYLEGAQNAPYQLIIPGDVILKLNKKAEWYVLEALPDGRYMLDGKVFRALDGKFPEYRMVIPLPEQMTGEAAQFDPELLGRCVKAIKTFHKLSKDSTGWAIKTSGPRSSGVISGGSSQAITVIMPINHKHGSEVPVSTFMTPCQEFQKAA